jgi:hypothetical protein
LRSIPVVAFGITLAASWEATANGFQAGLENGGAASLVWGFLVAGPGTALIVLSLAEMASMYVTYRLRNTRAKSSTAHRPSVLNIDG